METLIDVKPLPEASKPKPIEGREVAFNKVSFGYPGTDHKAIDNISFKIPEGKTYALVGPSGGGKTTIARLVPRFWDADEGHVSVGGTNVKDVAKEDLMKNISFVFQNTRLFKTTILENVKYGTPGAMTKDIKKALESAQCDEIIDRLPDGVKTKIGTEGTYLSGGEQQRISLARAFLKNSPVIVLDEATAFADPENEHLIHAALKKLTRGKTVLMIAHRLNSVMDVDSILVVEKGKIVEQGKHQDLIKKKGLYSRMWQEYQHSVEWTIGGGA
jgi:ATP-binding cassette subfamily B protein